MAKYKKSDIDILWADAPEESRGHKLKSPKKHGYVDYDRGHKLKESRRKGTKLSFHDNDSRKKGKKGTKLSSRKYHNNNYEEGK